MFVCFPPSENCWAMLLVMVSCIRGSERVQLSRSHTKRKQTNSIRFLYKKRVAHFLKDKTYYIVENSWSKLSALLRIWPVNWMFSTPTLTAHWTLRKLICVIKHHDHECKSNRLNSSYFSWIWESRHVIIKIYQYENQNEQKLRLDAGNIYKPVYLDITQWSK